MEATRKKKLRAEAKAKYDREYLEKNRDKHRAAMRRYYHRNKKWFSDYHKQHYKENRDKIREQKRKYHVQNRVKIAAYHKEYFQKNKKRLMRIRKIREQKKKASLR